MKHEIFTFHINTVARFVDDYLLYLLARASSLASGAFHARLEALGVTVSTWRVLAVLDGAGEVTLGELSQRCLFKQPTMTKIVDRLEHLGLVVRSAGTDDRRQRFVRLSARGRAEVAGLIEEARRHEARLLSGYTAEERDLLKRSLRDLIDHCRAESAT